jgi:hypothetical protein
VSGRLVLLPGLGAGAELLEPQRRAFPDLEVLPWLDPRPDESLDEFGRRMAEASTLDGGVEPTEVVRGGGHFINVTHADQVNGCVQRAREEK